MGHERVLWPYRCSGCSTDAMFAWIARLPTAVENAEQYEHKEHNQNYEDDDPRVNAIITTSNNFANDKPKWTTSNNNLRRTNMQWRESMWK